MIDELRSLVIFVGGCALAIVGAKMQDETLRAIGLVAIGGVIGMTAPGQPKRDTGSRTRRTDHEQ